MTSSRSDYGRPWPARAARFVLRGGGRMLKVVFQGLGEIGFLMAGVPGPSSASGASAASAAPQPPAPAPAVLDGPPPGHPERLVAELCLSPGEMEIWCMLGGLTRWPL